MISILFAVWSCVCAIVSGVHASSALQKKLPALTLTVSHDPPQAQIEREIAFRFAPVFYQALGDRPRSDYLTNFDFDGDWRGDNNWAHAEDGKLPLRAYVYYSVVETAGYLFIHYAVYHPRDYKGGDRKGIILSDLIREGTTRGGKYDPTGLAEEAALAHENDMEGCLVVVAKHGNDLEQARVAFVETLHHNNFSRYLPGEGAAKAVELIRLEGQHVLLYIEPKGHGIEAFLGTEKQTGKKEFLVYRSSGYAKQLTPPEFEKMVCRDLDTSPCVTSLDYDLLPIRTTLWPKAQAAPNQTYGEVCDYGQLSIAVQKSDGNSLERRITIGKIGCAFLGRVGGHNMARPPWAWFDKDEREQPVGRWFFDPASEIKRDFHLDDTFSTSYVRLPFWANPH